MASTLRGNLRGIAKEMPPIQRGSGSTEETKRVDAAAEAAKKAMEVPDVVLSPSRDLYLRQKEAKWSKTSELFTDDADGQTEKSSAYQVRNYQACVI